MPLQEEKISICETVKQKMPEKGRKSYWKWYVLLSSGDRYLADYGAQMWLNARI